MGRRPPSPITTAVAPVAAAATQLGHRAADPGEVNPDLIMVPSGDGEIAVLDFGGTGPEVLLVHAAGRCARSWTTLAERLAPRVHCYALDLPGHGKTTASATDARQVWPAIIDAAQQLRLDRPVLVGRDESAFFVTAVAATRPDLVRAVVSIGGQCLRERADNAGRLAPADAPRAAADMARRLARLRSELSPAERAHAAWTAPDGSAQLRPSLAGMIACCGLPPDAEVFPEPELLARVTVPLWLVIARDGPSGETIPRAQAWAALRPGVGLLLLAAGEGTSSASDRLADVILAAAGAGAPGG